MPSSTSYTDAVVTLIALDSKITHPERRILLTRDSNVVNLGRASHTQAKGRMSAADNGLFDSPVVSRNHAKLTADLDGKTISIEDLGSTHGTFVNEAEIPKNEARLVKAGDNLRFGSPIYRGDECYVPVTVGISVEFIERNRTRTFQVPDGDSEIEDEELPPDHVDLTREPAVAYVDLTSEPAQSPVPPSSKPDVVAEAARHDISLNFAEPAFDLVLETHRDDASSIWLSDEDVDCDDNESELCSQDSHDLLSDDDESDGVSRLENSANEEDSGLDSNEEEFGSESNDTHFLWDEASSDLDNFESDDGNKEGRDYIPYAFSPILSESVHMAPRATEMGAAPIQTGLSRMPSSMTVLDVPPNPAGPAQPPGTYAAAVHITSSSVPSLVRRREASPSDAAMPLLSSNTLVTTGPTQIEQEFLTARQDNKDRVAETGGANWTDERTEHSICSLTTEDGLNPRRAVNQERPASHGPLPFGPFSFLPKDVNSAFAYEQKKQSTIAQSQTTTADAESIPRRVHVGINDIVDSTQSEQPRATAKRKASDISEVTPEEMMSARSGAEAPWNEARTQSKEMASSRVMSQPLPVISTPQDTPALHPVPTTLDGPRPRKKLRAFVRGMGYYALGGITVGALVFGSLAATSPAF